MINSQSHRTSRKLVFRF